MAIDKERDTDATEKSRTPNKAKRSVQYHGNARQSSGDRRVPGKGCSGGPVHENRLAEGDWSFVHKEGRAEAQRPKVGDRFSMRTVRSCREGSALSPQRLFVMPTPAEMIKKEEWRAFWSSRDKLDRELMSCRQQLMVLERADEEWRTWRVKLFGRLSAGAEIEDAGRLCSRRERLVTTSQHHP